MVASEDDPIGRHNGGRYPRAIEYFIEVVHITDLAWLRDAHALLLKSLPAVILHGHIGVGHEAAVQKEAADDCARSTFAVVAMHDHHVFGVFCVLE